MHTLLHPLSILYRYPMTIFSVPRHTIDNPAAPRTESLGNHPDARCSVCEDAGAEIEKLKVEVASLTAALGTTAQELDRWREKDTSAKYEVNRLRADRDDWRQLAESRYEMNIELSKDAKDLQARLSQMDAQASRSEANVVDLQRGLSRAQNECRKTAALLETKGTELREAQLYLNKMDDVTDRDVQAIVEKLNSTIFQTAATVANSFQERCQCRREVVVVDGACGRLERSQLISRDLASAIRSVDHSGDSVLVQTAIQTVVALYSRWLCATWDFRVDESCLLRRVYTQIRERGTYWTSTTYLLYLLYLTGMTRTSVRRW